MLLHCNILYQFSIFTLSGASPLPAVLEDTQVEFRNNGKHMIENIRLYAFITESSP